MVAAKPPHYLFGVLYSGRNARSTRKDSHLDNTLTPAAQVAPEPAFFDELTRLMDTAADKIRHGEILHAFRMIEAPLSRLWAKACESEWADAVRWHCRKHALHELVLQDPMTNRAAIKPRGYAGDAVMMDYLYYAVPPEGTNAFGQSLFRISTRASAGLSVCFRRQLLRGLIDGVVSSTAGARIMSVASGHARELTGSLVYSPLFDGEFVALDQDPLSCAEVERNREGTRVRTVNMGVIDLMKAYPETLGAFDLIYSAGLYDYLSDTLARRLTRHLLKMLRPGGRLLIANFLTNTPARGYMELFMDWNLIYRSEEEMRALVKHAGATDYRSFVDPYRSVVYVEVTNAS